MVKWPLFVATKTYQVTFIQLEFPWEQWIHFPSKRWILKYSWVPLIYCLIFWSFDIEVKKRITIQLIHGNSIYQLENYFKRGTIWVCTLFIGKKKLKSYFKRILHKWPLPNFSKTIFVAEKVKNQYKEPVCGRKIIVFLLKIATPSLCNPIYWSHN